MATRSKTTGKKPLLGSHQRSWVWGRNVVAEALRAGVWLPYEVCCTAEAAKELGDLAEAAEVPVEIAPAARLAQLCGATDHQGVIAKMPPFPYADQGDLLRRVRQADASFAAVAEPGPTGEAAGPAKKILRSFFVIADHVQDPYNFGAIVRSAEGFGAAGVFVPSRRQVGVTSQVARSSAGAVNHVPIARVEDLLSLAATLKRNGVRLVAASEHSETTVATADLAGPVAVVIGNEGVGIDPDLLAACDVAVAIPLAGQVGSLNAAVAAGILLYEVARQRGAPAAGDVTVAG